MAETATAESAKARLDNQRTQSLVLVGGWGYMSIEVFHAIVRLREVQSLQYVGLGVLGVCFLGLGLAYISLDRRGPFRLISALMLAGFIGFWAYALCFTLSPYEDVVRLFPSR